MTGYTRWERVCLGLGLAVILCVTAAILYDWSHRGISSTSEAVAPPPPALKQVVVRGRLVDLPGFAPRASILGRTRLSLWVDGRQIGEELTPDGDGRFWAERPLPPGETKLRVVSELLVNRFDRGLDRTATKDYPVHGTELGELQLPRPEDWGWIEYEVLDSRRRPLVPEFVGLDPAEGTPGVGIARLDDLDIGANAPLEYRRGHRGTILHVPPGDYWLRAAAPGRLLSPTRVRVGRGAATAVVQERPAAHHVRGIVREAGTGRGVEDVEISVSSVGYEGERFRDPALVRGRSSRAGAYLLPIADPFPPEGVRLTFSRAGFRSAELTLKAEQFKGEASLLIDVDLAFGRP